MRRIAPSIPQEIVGTPTQLNLKLLPFFFVTCLPTNLLGFATAGIASFIVELSSPQSSLHESTQKAKIGQPPAMPGLAPDVYLPNQKFDIHQPYLDPVIFNESLYFMPFEMRNDDVTAEHIQSFDDWLSQVEAGGMMMS